MLATRGLDLPSQPLEQDFEKLFHEQYPLVYRTAYSLTGSREDAEDVVQTIFLRLYRRKELSGFQKNPKPYLYRAAVNAAISIIRTRRRHILTDDVTRFDRAVESAPPPAESALREEFLNALAELSPGAVEILILRYEHHYSDAEIASLLGTSRGAIAVRLYRARRRLKKFMEKTR